MVLRDLDFKIEAVKVERIAVSPLLLFALRAINRSPNTEILNVMLNTQIRIEPGRRRYSAAERERLSDLFGNGDRWAQSLHSFLWTHVTTLVPAIGAERVLDLAVPCSFDFNVAATKFFYGLEDGEAPLNFLFSGSIFYRDSDGSLQIEQVPWSKECAYRLPIKVWRSMVDHYYPHSAWICLEREVFEALYRYKRQKRLGSFEEALRDLLKPQTASVAL